MIINPECRCGHPMRWHRNPNATHRDADDCLAKFCVCQCYNPPKERTSSRPNLKVIRAGAA